jgi:hypothetical protein
VLELYRALAVLVPALHLGFILWVIFGATVTGRRVWAAAAHGVSLAYGVFIELAPVGCPLTRWENWARARAGERPYAGDFLRHALLRVIYPDVSLHLLAAGAGAVLALNAWIYWRRFASRARATRRP